MATTLDSHLDKPSTTAIGDGPADTTDPTERASSATPDKGAAALAGFGTVNAVVKLPDHLGVAAQRDDADDRFETFDVEGPDGQPVTVTRNIETGEAWRGSGHGGAADSTGPGQGPADGGSTDTGSTSSKPSTEGARPSDAAGKATWVDYAVSKGANLEQARASDKNTLIEKYGK